MLVSPSKIKKNRILKNRTLNFETVQKMYGNMVFIPTLDKDSMISVLQSNLFKPTQMMAIFTPRRIKAIGKGQITVDQKDYYKEMKVASNNKLKKGKTILNSYNGQNLIVDLYNDFALNYDAFSTKKKGIMLQKTMATYIANNINKYADDSDYPDSYVIFPIKTYTENLKSILNRPSNIVEPYILFLKEFFNEKLTGNKEAYDKIKLFIFYNPNANALVAVDLKDPDFEKTKAAVLLKIFRLNSFNNGEDSLEDIDETEEEIDNDENLSKEDKIENKKEQIKTLVLKKVAKTLRADNLTDFDAASQDEQLLINSIDKKIDSYLNNEDNLKKSFNDMVDDVNKDNDVKAKAIRYVETKKAAAQRLETLSKGLEKEVEIIGSLQDLDDDSKENVADSFKVKEEYIDPRIERSHLSSLDEEYNKKQSMTDLTNIVSSFSNSEYIPITVDSFNLTDASTYQDMKKTLSIRYKTDEGKPLSFQIDIPDIVDKRYLYLGGNKKTIKKQLIRLPITKVKNNRVEITTNFNKMTVERTNGKLSRKNAYLLKKLKEFTNNPNVEIVYGYNTAVNSNMIYKNDFEYEELAASLSSIKTSKYYLLFNRDSIGEEIGLLDIQEDFFGETNRTPIGFERRADGYIAIFYIENETREIKRYEIGTNKIDKVSNSMFDFIVSDVLKIDMSTIPSIGKSFVYTVVKFLATTYPVFAVVGSQVGLTNVLKRYNVKYQILDKQLRGNIDMVEVKFKDKYLYYEDTFRATLLLNALYLLHPENYTYEQFDTDIPYTHYFMQILGDTVGMYTRNTLKINLAVVVDPITRDILKDLKLPTNIIDILLYANTLLVGNQYRPLNDLTNYRIRGNELVMDMLYKIIADSYVNYQKHKMNGRPLNLVVPKNALIKQLLQEPNINDKSSLNPIVECEENAKASAKGFMGVNINKKIVSLYSDI